MVGIWMFTVQLFKLICMFGNFIMLEKYIVKEIKGEVDKITNLLNLIIWLDKHNETFFTLTRKQKHWK